MKGVSLVNDPVSNKYVGSGLRTRHAMLVPRRAFHMACSLLLLFSMCFAVLHRDRSLCRLSHFFNLDCLV
jgi:hypothetical protein